eukprot:GFUD01038706.1.p1 GENE.GFUD01038706.1~~GFUD01038706.1.p1  ORF type:complete len:662 (+),score=221.66 GFUD01038706.1:35-2020(+)
MSLYDFNTHFWGEVAKKCSRAVVFIDTPAAECLHWSGGVGLLHKAASVKEFSAFESASKHSKKGVFIISGPVSGKALSTLKCILQSSSLEYVVVITNCHPTIHTWSLYPAKDWNTEDRSGFDQLEEQVLMWMGNVNMTAEIFYLPLFLVTITPRLLLTPTYSTLFPLLQPDIIRSAALWRTLNPNLALHCEPGDWPALPHELQMCVRQVVGSLHSLMTTLGAKEEIWSVGRMARQLGDQLEGWGPARTRRKTTTNKVSLILVDRTLDLASCVRYGGDTLLARATEVLERLPGHTVDVEVDLSKVFGMKDGGDKSSLVPGSLASPGVDREKEEEELESLLFSTEKECLNLLHKNLVEASPKKKTESAGKKFVTGSTLEADLRDYTGDYDALLSSLGTVSRAQCAVSSLAQERNIRRKRLQAWMGQFARMICEGGERVLGDLTDLVRGRKDNSLKLDDILLLLVFVYNSSDVRDAFPQEEEDRLRSVLGEALLKEGVEGGMGPVFEELCRRAGGDKLDELVALSVVNIVWERLEGMKSSREGLGSYQSLLNYDGEYCGLLEQLLGDIYHPARKDVAALYHHAGGLGAMLRSGLGWLGSAPAKPHPRENPWVIFFVVGGVTPSEVAASQNLVEGTGRLTMGGTRLMSPEDLLHMAFVNNTLLTD